MIASGLSIIFITSDGLCGRNDVTSDKVNFRPYIRQNLSLKTTRTWRCCVALKTNCSFCTLKMSKVPAEFYPKKLYRCPCLTYLINEIYNAGTWKYSLILKAIEIGKMLSIFVFGTRTEDKTSGISLVHYILNNFYSQKLTLYAPQKKKATFILKLWTVVIVNNALNII